MRLIDADELKEKLTELKRNNLTPSWCVALNLIDNAPTIKTFTLLDIEEQYRKGLEKGLSEWETERPQGEWIEHHYISCGNILRWKADVVEQKCNRCDRYTLRWRGTLVSEFCSNCGADMRGEEK